LETTHRAAAPLGFLKLKKTIPIYDDLEGGSARITTCTVSRWFADGVA